MGTYLRQNETGHPVASGPKRPGRLQKAGAVRSGRTARGAGATRSTSVISTSGHDLAKRGGTRQHPGDRRTWRDGAGHGGEQDVAAAMAPSSAPSTVAAPRAAVTMENSPRAIRTVPARRRPGTPAARGGRPPSPTRACRRCRRRPAGRPEPAP